MEGLDNNRLGKEVEKDYHYSSLIKKNGLVLETRRPTMRRNIEVENCCSRILKMCCLGVLVVMFLISLIATIVVWGTTFIEDSVIRDMPIKNNSQSGKFWFEPPLQPLFKIRIFNYTNVDRFMVGDDDKLHVVEAGPYVYRERFQRVNVEFYDNGTASYQERRAFTLMPELTVGSMTDKLVVPNMAFLGSASIMKDQMYLARVAMSTLYRSLEVKPFLSLDAESLFWGYEDQLFNLGKSYMAIKGSPDDAHNKKIGLLVARNGTGSTRYNVHTGTADITKLGVIDHIAGKKKHSIWGTEECNRIDGTDGSMWPPALMREDATLYMYMKDMCRKFPMVFKEYTQVHDMTAMRFHPPRSVYARGDTHPENACFCHEHSKSCPPSGVFNSSPCAFNAPVMMSFPHFYLGDPVLLEAVDGLKPDPLKHDMFIDLHPEFGFPLGGESRFQVNIMVRKSMGIYNLDRFQDEMILPIAWFEVVVDDIPDDVLSDLKYLNFATHTAKLLILYIFLTTLLVVCIVAAKYMYTNHYRKPSSSSLSHGFNMDNIRKNNY